MSKSNSETNIPSSLAELTADRLSRLLQPAFPGAAVERVDIGRVINGTATKVRLLLEYNAQGHQYRLPPTMWAKAGFEEHSKDNASIYLTETRFYRSFSKQLNIGCPQVYAAEFDESTGQALVLLEDMLARNATFPDALSPLGSVQAEKVIVLLAKLHARYWRPLDAMGGPLVLDGHDWLQPGGELVSAGVIAGVLSPDNWKLAMKLPRARHVSGRLNDRDLVTDILLRAVQRNHDQAHCLLHGDAHIGNLYETPDGEVSFIDWQTVMLGFWAHDVAEFMTSALTVNDRRQLEESLIRLYVNTLRDCGIEELIEDEAWLEYRRHAIYGFNWVLCPQSWQPESICEPTAERACAAIHDLKTLEAWQN